MKLRQTQLHDAAAASLAADGLRKCDHGLGDVVAAALTRAMQSAEWLKARDAGDFAAMERMVSRALRTRGEK